MFAAYLLEIPGSQELMLDWECVDVKDSSSLEKGDHLKKRFSVVPSTELLHKTQHYYRTDFCSRLFVPVAFGPGKIGGFYPGSNG